MPTKISARVVADSVCATRITTVAVTLPKLLIAQGNTHRVFSRNSATSRAILARLVRQQVIDDPYIPDEWPSMQPGMKGGPPLEGPAVVFSKQSWLRARDACLREHEFMTETMGVHKEVANRILEAWMWSDWLVTSTDWTGFFAQRLPGHGAQGAMERVALAMKEAIDESEPQTLFPGDWHLPFTEAGFWLRKTDAKEQIWRSAARCARISYKRQDRQTTLEEDKARHDDLIAEGHWSPLEHQAQAMESDGPCRNFVGWRQYRAMVDGGGV